MPLYLKDKMVSGISLGVPGKTAYEAAKEGGYTGTEEEFAQILANAATTDYVDEAIGKIPAPDVSGQIEEHNTDEEAHPDIRTTVDGKVSKGGDMMTGQLHIDTTNTNQGVIVGGNNTTSYFASIGADGINYQRTLQIVNNSTDANSMNAMKYAVWTNGVEETYPVLHTGNKNQIFTYGTDDLTAGTSPLASGQLHFVYE